MLKTLATRGQAGSSSSRRRERDDGGDNYPEQGYNADPQDHQLSILTDLDRQTKGSTFGFLEQLLEARGSLECSEAGRALQALLAAAP